MRVLKLALLVTLVALAGACSNQEAVSRSSTKASPTSTTTVATGTGESPPAAALIRCSRGGAINVSFDGMQLRGQSRLGPSYQIYVFYKGHSVLKFASSPGFPAPIKAPGTTGATCIAKMAHYQSPVVLLYTEAGACCGATLQVAYPTSHGRYATTEFNVPATHSLSVQFLSGSLAIVTGDPRFEFLFTTGYGSFTPIVVDRFEGGRLVDVSTQFPDLIVADASNLSRTTRKQWFRTDGGFALVGEQDAWLADECRLGKAPRAWKVVEQQVYDGRYRHWMAHYEGPSYLRSLKADLVRWGYCPSA